jgi:uncharacterized protein (DUF488 family)
LSASIVYTVGHSTHSIGDFIALLDAHAIGQVADIRTIPRSRRHPQFASDELSRSLAEHHIRYRHVPELGGLRKPRSDSRNTAWRNEGFRGYADHMETEAFAQGLEALIRFAGLHPDRVPAAGERAAISTAPGRAQPPTAIMCAEAVWWRCHRQLVADALVARGIDVRHITSTGDASPHTLTEFATVENGRVVYRRLL